MENTTEDLTAATSSQTQKSSEQIGEEMLQTRESMSEKVTAIENQVVDSAQSAADTLTGAMDAVQSFTHAAQNLFDVGRQIQNRPLTSVGVSAGLGFITGLLVFRTRSVAPPVAPTAMPYATPPLLTAQQLPAAPPVPTAPASPGLFHDLLGMLGRKAMEIVETAIFSAVSANPSKQEETPKLADVDEKAATSSADSLRYNGIKSRSY